MTKREHRALNYDVLRDRRQPPSLPMSLLMIAVIGGVVALVFIGLGVSQAVSASQPPVPTLAALPASTPTIMATETETPSETPTPTETLAPSATPSPDSWGMTGTALALATASSTPTATVPPDYCWWLTPSPTPTATLPFTPDAWSMTGTAVYLATYPPQTPTPQPLRELCLDIPTWTPSPIFTASLTPLPLYSLEASMTLSESDMTATQKAWPTAGKLPTFAPPTDVPTRVIQPPPVNADPPQQIVITSEPQIIQITSAPIVVQLTAPPQQVIIITATFAPTQTPSPTPTATATETPTETATATDTDLPTSTPTETATATDIPTATPSETPAPTQEATPETTVTA